MKPRSWRALAGGVIFASAMLGEATAYAATSCASLITPDQATAVLGVAAMKGVDTGTTTCHWVQSKFAAGKMKSVWITILDSREYEGIARQPSVPGELQVTPVSGIGDGAMLFTMQHSKDGPILYVKKGNNYFSVGIGGLAEDQAKAAEKTIAQQIIPKL